MDPIAAEIAKAIGMWLKQLREDRGWSQQELADRTNVSRTTIAHLEAGDNRAKWSTIVALAEAMDVPAPHLSDLSLALAKNEGTEYTLQLARQTVGALGFDNEAMRDLSLRGLRQALLEHFGLPHPYVMDVIDKILASSQREPPAESRDASHGANGS